MKLSSTFRVGAVMTGLLLMSIFGTAKATLVEGFESGTFSGSENTSGDVGIRNGNYYNIAPTEGTRQLLLTTINNTSDLGYTNQSGSDAVSSSTIASFLTANNAGTVSTSQVRDGTAIGMEGSAFTISLGVLQAGTTISFNYDFLTDEVPPGQNRDFAFYSLSGSSGITVFYDALNVGLHPTTGGNIFSLESGYQTLVININTTGTYTLGIGVMDATTTDNPSALLIDNIQVISPVPEPTTIAFSVAGAALLVALRSRFRKSS